MVNADKHRQLKIYHEITKPERLVKQVNNRKKNYNKAKYKVNAFNNLQKMNSTKDLERLSNKI